MTEAEAHQQELEHQQWLAEVEEIKSAMRKNHGKFAGLVSSIRDSVDELELEIVVKDLLEALEEYEELKRRINA